MSAKNVWTSLLLGLFIGSGLTSAYTYCDGASYYDDIICTDCCCNEHRSSVYCCSCDTTWIIGLVIGLILSIGTVVFIIVLCCCCIAACPLYNRKRGRVVAPAAQPTVHVVGVNAGPSYQAGRPPQHQQTAHPPPQQTGYHQQPKFNPYGGGPAPPPYPPPGQFPPGGQYPPPPAYSDPAYPPGSVN